MPVAVTPEVSAREVVVGSPRRVGVRIRRIDALGIERGRSVHTRLYIHATLAVDGWGFGIVVVVLDDLAVDAWRRRRNVGFFFGWVRPKVGGERRCRETQT